MLTMYNDKYRVLAPIGTSTEKNMNRTFRKKLYIYHRISRIFRDGKNLQNAIISIYILITEFLWGIKILSLVRLRITRWSIKRHRVKKF